MGATFTSEQVERAAEALWFGAGRGALYGWGNLSETSRQAYLLYAEKILSAAGAPEKVAPVVDEAALEKMLREVAALAAKRALEMYLRGESK